MTPRLKKIDLSKIVEEGNVTAHPDISTEKDYLAKIDGQWYAGKFERQWYGLLFQQNLGLTCGFQLDGDGWEELYEIAENKGRRK